MEFVVIALSLICLVVAGFSSAFLSLIQPLWSIIDIAVSEKLSKGGKIALLVILLAGTPICIFSVVGIIFLPLLVLIPIGYACFYTNSASLKRSTRWSFLLLICGTIGLGVSASLSTSVRQKMLLLQQLRWDSQTAYQETNDALNESTMAVSTQAPEQAEATPEPKVAHLDTSEFNLNTFCAVHFASSENESIAQYTAGRVNLNSAVPFQRPSIYPLTHIVIDPANGSCYGITKHKFGKVDTQTGSFAEISIEDESIPKLSWPGGITYDTKRARVLLTSRRHLYAYSPKTEQWEVLGNSTGLPIVYSPSEDLLYTLDRSARKIQKINGNGAMVAEMDLSQRVPIAKTWKKIQLVCTEDKLLLLASEKDLQIHVIDPATGQVNRYQQRVVSRNH